MKVITYISSYALFLTLMTITIEARIIDRYDLAEILNNNGFTNFTEWICIIGYTSNFNTRIFMQYPNGITTNGLFGINSTYWCKNNKNGGACNAMCEQFRDDDIFDDIQCLKKIFSTHGVEAWPIASFECDFKKNHHVASWLLNEEEKSIGPKIVLDESDEYWTYGDLIKLLWPIFF